MRSVKVRTQVCVRIVKGRKNALTFSSAFCFRRNDVLPMPNASGKSFSSACPQVQLFSNVHSKIAHMCPELICKCEFAADKIEG